MPHTFEPSTVDSFGQLSRDLTAGDSYGMGNPILLRQETTEDRRIGENRFGKDGFDKQPRMLYGKGPSLTETRPISIILVQSGRTVCDTRTCTTVAAFSRGHCARRGAVIA